MMMSFIDFIHKYELKIEATSNTKLQQVLVSTGLDNVGNSLREGPISGDQGFFNLHPSKGTQMVAFINSKYFDIYGCSPPNKLSKFNTKRN